jgi:ribose/xylose/arabinose/galactoside ABC-type transport system permease subunit
MPLCSVDSMTPTWNPFRAALRAQESGLVVVIVLLAILLTIFGGSVEQPVGFRTTETGERVPIVRKENKFFNARTLTSLAKDTSFIAVMAVGMTFVIISGGIDLSVGSTYALGSVLTAMLLNALGPEGHSTNGIGPVLLGIATCVGVGCVCGALNGAMIVLLRVHPFIITLGTMAVFRGVAFVITKGNSIGTFPPAFRDFGRWSINGLSMTQILVMLLVTIVGAIYLNRTAAGRRVYAIGGNELASRYSGIRVQRVKLSVYIFSGLTAGISALLALGYYGSGSSGDGQSYELDVIAAAVVGGASLSGGRGSAIGALLGALLIQMIRSGIIILQIDENYSQIIIGAVIVIAVVLDQLNTWLARRRLLKKPVGPEVTTL